MTQPVLECEELAALRATDAIPEHCLDAWVPEKTPDCHLLGESADQGG